MPSGLPTAQGWDLGVGKGREGLGWFWSWARNEGVELEPDLTYSEYLIRVLDQKDLVTRRRTIKFYKIQWNQHSEEEATWESEDYLLKKKFPEFLASI